MAMKRPAGNGELETSKRPRAPATLTCTLANGVKMPMVGFGTAFFYDGVRRPETVYTALPQALDIGYRLIDTASMYGCERQVGDVLGRYFMDGKLKREDVFITTKAGHPPTPDFPNAQTDYVYDPDISAYTGVLQEFYASLDNLGVGYVDMMLLHWPGLAASEERFPADWNLASKLPTKEVARRKRREMWAALEFLYERKLARAIGVSNFTAEHLEHLLPSCKVKPMNNQFEVHPYLVEKVLVDFCAAHDIRVTAYSPLAGGKVKLVEDEQIMRLAKQKGITPSQLVLGWLVQRGIMVIPKSSNKDRLAQNLEVAASGLTPEDMSVMASLDRDLHTCTDPRTIP